MALSISVPTSNTTPDPGQGGAAVTGAANTGHASTSCSAIGDDIGVNQSKSCLWTGFANVPGLPVTKTLKVTHTSDGTRNGLSSANQFDLEYSLNGGGAWLSAVSRVNMTTPAGPTVFSVAIPAGQDLTQVHLRDFISASATTIGHDATASATIADIQIEVVTQDQQPITLW